jgi:hypothetical protein
VRLLSELTALSAGSRPSAMLRPAPTRYRRPDPPAMEGVKGRLAAIMEFRQKTGSTRKAASQWVARNAPPEVKRRLGSLSSSAVDSWLAKWGGERGATAGSGREGYLNMRAILDTRQPNEQQLKTILGVLAQSVPAQESN